MALKDRKITEAGIAQHGVIAAPDRLTGTAAENKKVFDKLVRNVVAEQLNGLVDDLAGSGGASEIGASPISGLSGENVQEVLVAMKAVLDKRIAEAGVASFKGRSGLVVPESGDYTAAMVGAAPAGYGRGNSIRLFNLTQDPNEWTRMADDMLAEIPSGQTYRLQFQDYYTTPFQVANGVLYKGSSEGNDAWICGTTSDGHAVQRVKIGGTWKPWEWVNPPMELGVEYRTTERYSGFPVYTKLFEIDNLPATAGTATTAEAGLIAADATRVIECVGWITYFGVYLPDGFDDVAALRADLRSVVVIAKHDLSDSKARIKVKYIKEAV